MSIYNSQSPFNQGAKRSEIKAANKQRRQFQIFQKEYSNQYNYIQDGLVYTNP